MVPSLRVGQVAVHGLNGTPTGYPSVREEIFLQIRTEQQSADRAKRPVMRSARGT
jgi:hypothetical protein